MKFHAIPLGANDLTEGNIAEQNFRQEDKNSIECFWRELVQNSLDIDEKREVRNKEKKLHVRVIPNSDIPDIKYLTDILVKPNEWMERAEKSSCDPLDILKYGLLIVEEENTVGICGRLDPNKMIPDDGDQESEYWDNFWFSEGKPSKTGDKGGRRGQGKVTYHSVSKFRTVFAITKRATDDKTLLFGKCRLRCTFSGSDGKRYKSFGFFGNATEDLIGEVVKPIDDCDHIAKFEKKLGIPHRDDYGTTWIFPFVDIKNFKFEPILKILAKEYCYAFAAGKLSVRHCTDDITIDMWSLPELIKQYCLEEPDSEKVEFIQDCTTFPQSSIYSVSEEWSNGNAKNKMNPEAFTEEQRDELGRRFENEEIVALSLPIKVKPRIGDPEDSKIEVYLKKSEKLKKTDEQIIRSSLLIASEKYLSRIPGKFYGLVVANDPSVATLLSESEDPSHLKFNTRTAADKYENAADVIRCVRYALPRLVRLLGSSEKPDKDALASILYVYDNVGKPGGAGKDPSGPGPSGDPPTPPDSGLSVFNCSQSKGKFVVRKNPAYSSDMPNKMLMKFGYETGYGIGDPIKNWSVFDFDLSNESYSVETNNDARLVARVDNQIEIECVGKNPRVEIGGFSEFTRVQVKIYET